MELAEQAQDLIFTIQEYFGQLTQEEIYGWIAEGVGLVLLVVGIVML